MKLDARDIAGTAGLLLIVGGTSLLSVAWGMIVGGVILLGLSVFGYIYGAMRHDRRAARNS